MPRRFYDTGQTPKARIAAWKRAHEAGVAGTLSNHRTRQSDDPAPSGLLAALAGDKPLEKPPRPPMPVTPAELAPLVLISHGLSEREAAEMLGKAHDTVRKQTKQARRKLGVKTTTEACCEALRRGLID